MPPDYKTAAVNKRGTSVESWPRNGGRAASTSLIQSLSQYAIGSLKSFALFLFSCIRSWNQKRLIPISHETNHLSSHKQRVMMGHMHRGSLANRHTHSTMPKTYARTFSFAARPCLQISRREICQNTCQVLFIAPYISMMAIGSTSS